MSLRKRLLVKPPSGALVPSEHFGVVLYEGDGSTSHSINGGKFGAAAYFDGSNSYVDVSLNHNNQSFSWSTWVYANALSNQFPTVIAGMNNSTNTNNGSVVVTSTGITIHGSTLYGTVSSTFNTKTWYHVGMVYDSDANTVKAIINGQLYTPSSTTSNTFPSQNKMRIGRADATSTAWNGKIDQVRLFTKALSSSEVSTLYAETAPESLDPLSEDTTETLQVLGDSSCIATYRFENNEDDLSGNYDGTGVNVQYAAGRYGQAARFGNSSYVDLGTITRTSSMTISAWVKTTGNNLPVVFLDNGVVFRLYINSSGYAEANNLSGTSATSTTTVNNGSWNHLVAVYNDSGFRRIYVNSSLEDSETYTTATRTYKDGIAIDNNNPASSQIDIDQVRIFNKAISAAEVTTLYNENSLVASYRFEGNANDDMRAYDGTATNVTYEYGLNFTPDFVWGKSRTGARNHGLYDSTRGPNKRLVTSGTQAEISNSAFASFDTGGFTVTGTDSSVNNDGEDYVAWCLKANGGTTSSNTDGSVTSTVQANTDAGFSIVQYTGTGANGTIGHGLSAAPELIIIKRTDATANWSVYTPLGSNNIMFLSLTDAASSGSSLWWNNTDPTSTVFTTGSYNVHNASGSTNIAYCFHSVDGFSKFGSYEGNGTTEGPIVETGFEPAFIIIKDADGLDNWAMVDNKRATTNPRQTWLRANLANAEFSNTVDSINFYSNGFQIAGGTSVSNFLNESGHTFIYMAFAADPDTEAPTVAKSFSTVTYTGTGSAQTISGLGFKPSFLWTKQTDGTFSHIIHDTLNQPHLLITNSTGALITNGSNTATFTDDGFSLEGGANHTSINNSGSNFVAWAWKADDNEPTINTEGSIDSLVSANANAGFSIVKYTGTGSNTTVGHGLSSAPEMMIIKDLDNIRDWAVYSKYNTGASGNAGEERLKLNTTDATTTYAPYWNSTLPSATVFSLGNEGNVNTSAQEYIAYCFHSVAGYSDIGSYSGSGASGNAQNVGFAPDLVILKSTNAVTSWGMFDTVRGANVLYSNLSNAESSDSRVTLTSTGFEFTGAAYNESGRDWIYMAFKIN